MEPKESLIKSSAIYSVLEYLSETERLKLQRVNKVFYMKLIPNAIYSSTLGMLGKDKFFSYSSYLINKRKIFFFDIGMMKWREKLALDD